MASLKCSVNNLDTKVVIWRKISDGNVLSVGTYMMVGDGSYSISHRDSRNEWNLVIKNVQLYHAGLYECQISTKEVISKNITLNVIDPPSAKKDIHISGPPYVERGDPIKLVCNATGVDHPPDDVDWFLNGNKIIGNTKDKIFITKFRTASTRTLHSELEVKHSRMEDSGTYICRSSDLAITSHHLTVLNANSNAEKRGTLGGDHGGIIPDGTSASQNSAKTIHHHSQTEQFICLLIAIVNLFQKVVH
ncbi:hypothetical protein ScPMuIL_018086 [Solemya velum]